jgi:hypothetical protein
MGMKERGEGSKGIKGGIVSGWGGGGGEEGIG